MSNSAPRSPPARVFAPRTVFIMLLVSISALVGLGVLGAYAPELRARARGGADALSRSAVGYAGLVRMLRETGVPVQIMRHRAPRPLGAPGLLILTPPFEASPRALSRAMTPRRWTLIIAPKCACSPDPQHPGWVQAGATILAPVPELLRAKGVTALNRDRGAANLVLKGTGGAFVAVGPLPAGRVTSLQTALAPAAKTLMTDAAGRPVLVRLDEWTYFLSDPDVMNNQGLASLDTARTALSIIDILRGAQGPVIFDVALNGYGRSRSLLGLALTPPFLGASLCALMAALLMGVHAAARFGPARPGQRALALGKAALLDNSAILIRLARREPKMGRRYAALARRALGRRVLAVSGADLAPDRDAARLDAALDRLTPPDRPPFSTLAAEAEAAADTASLMRAVRALHQVTGEILGEHR